MSLVATDEFSVRATKEIQRLADFAAVIVHKNQFFVLTSRINLLNLK